MQFQYKHNTKCLQCGKACDSRCSWSAELEPVDGWDAEYMPVKVTYSQGDRIHYVDSYIVHACPEYDNDHGQVGTRDIDPNGLISLLEAVLDLTRQDYIDFPEQRKKLEKWILDDNAWFPDPEGAIASLRNASNLADKARLRRRMECDSL